jgi:acetyl-CoA carboxylase carboxyltransferase component
VPALIRELLSFLPGNNLDDPPRARRRDPVDREDEALDTLVPASPNQPYDMLDVIHAVVDDGYFLEVHRALRANIIVGFARLGGRRSASSPTSRRTWPARSTSTRR